MDLPGGSWAPSWGTSLVDGLASELGSVRSSGSPGSCRPSPGPEAVPGPAVPGLAVPERTVILLLLPMRVSSRKQDLMWTLWTASASGRGPGWDVRISNEASELSAEAETAGQPRDARGAAWMVAPEPGPQSGSKSSTLTSPVATWLSQRPLLMPSHMLFTARQLRPLPSRAPRGDWPLGVFLWASVTPSSSLSGLLPGSAGTVSTFGFAHTQGPSPCHLTPPTQTSGKSCPHPAGGTPHSSPCRPLPSPETLLLGPRWALPGRLSLS